MEKNKVVIRDSGWFKSKKLLKEYGFLNFNGLKKIRFIITTIETQIDNGITIEYKYEYFSSIKYKIFGKYYYSGTERHNSEEESLKSLIKNTNNNNIRLMLNNYNI